MNASLALAVFIGAAAVSAGLILLLHPVLRRYAMARPNARSSHTTPTPQGAGIAVVAAAIGVTLAAAGIASWSSVHAVPELARIAAAAILIATIGAIDDIRSIAVAPRLFLQGIAVAAVVVTLPESLQVFPYIPLWADRVLLFVAVLWFVNLVNFMDGIDWMTVAEVVPIAGALALMGFLGTIPAHAAVLALALCGAVAGFAPFNRPVARLFLGDVGSLPIGLLLAWLLVLLAGAGHLTAAILLPMYYLCDATITLARRIIARERFWEAHRSHFYQRALGRGFSVTDIVTRVFGVNLVLAALATASVVAGSALVSIAAFAAGAALVAWLLRALARGRA